MVVYVTKQLLQCGGYEMQAYRYHTKKPHNHIFSKDFQCWEYIEKIGKSFI